MLHASQRLERSAAHDSPRPSADSLPAIPFNKVVPVGKELEYMAEAVASGKIAGDGAFTHKCHGLMQSLFGVHKVLLTTSCTHALEMAALLLDIAPGDEVICPSFTFVSTINAFVLRGAKPVFIDCRPDTLNMDEAVLEDLVTPRTRAILPVHYAGIGCEMDAIMDIANRHGVAVVEDNAHGLFGKYRGQWLGTFGCMATQSFHETKNFACGEGGALLINDWKFEERAEILREKGTNRSRFFRGQVDKYTWVDVGSSYLPADVLAAFLYAQLEVRDTIQARRKHIWTTYATELREWADTVGARMPIIPEHCDQAYHMFYLLMPSFAARQGLIGHLKENRITAVFHYLPLHTSEMGMQLGYNECDLPVTEDISDRLVRLPMFNGMTDDELARVVETVLRYAAA